jgi:hypothetical protein
MVELIPRAPNNRDKLRDSGQQTKNNKQKTNIPAPIKISFGILARRPENFAGSAASALGSLKFS